MVVELALHDKNSRGLEVNMLCQSNDMWVRKRDRHGSEMAMKLTLLY